MEDDNKKNSINLLPDDLKSKNRKKTSKKTEEVVYEPEMVRPDSEKLKKSKTAEISGSDVSVLQKISNWFENSFGFLKREKKEEKPRIQELQELVGKSQHVGEIMINDDEVLPDEERDEVIKKEDEEEESGEEDKKVNIKDSAEKDKDKVEFITREDQEKELLREKDKASKQEDEEKQIASPQEISLHPNKDVEMSKSDSGVFTMPESLEKVALDESSEEELDDKEKEQTEKIKVALEEMKEIPKEEPGLGFWDKIKAFFAGIFAAKPKEIKDDKADIEEEKIETNVPPSSLMKYSSKDEENVEDDSHVVSTPTSEFASGVKIMQQDSEAAKKKEEPSFEEKPADFRQNMVSMPDEKEELSKAQEELFSGVPEGEQEIEDIFSQVDKSSEKPVEEPQELVKEEKIGLWDKIKAFFAGIFAVKPKEIKELEEKPAEEVEEPVQVEEPQAEPEEPKEEPVALSQPEEPKEEEREVRKVNLEEPAQPIQTEEPQAEPEKPTEEPVAFSAPIDEGVQESLPKSLTDPDAEAAGIAVLTPEVEVSEDYAPPKDEQDEKEKKSMFAGLKAFFAGLFKKKNKDEDIDLSGQIDSPTTVEGGEVLLDEQAADSDAANAVNIDSTQSKQKDDKQVVAEDELSSKFHQPSASTVKRIIDEEGGIDLIPIAIKTKSWGQVMQLIVAAVVGSLIIIMAFYATLHFQQISLEKEKEKQQNQISDIEKKIIEYQNMNEEIDVLGKDLALVNDLFSRHIYWTNLFELLEKYTLEDVYYSGFSSGAGGSLSFSATGKDYGTAARQLKLLQSEEAKELAESVTINSITSSGSSVSFSVIIILNEDLFYFTE